MPAEGLHFFEEISTRELSASGIAHHFQVSNQSAAIRLKDYEEHKAKLLGDTFGWIDEQGFRRFLRYDYSTHKTVLRASRAATETGASENLVKSQTA